MGGISALKEAVELLPYENFLFYGDTAHVPYGTRSTREVRELVLNFAKEVEIVHPKAIVLACNTATSAAAHLLRAKYSFPILGMEPAIKPALTKKGEHRRVLLLATELTARENKLKNLRKKVDREHRLDVLPMPALVEYAEQLTFSGPELEEDIDALLSSYDFNEYSAVVLGCTHFIWFKELLKSYLPPHIDFVDGNNGTINHLSSLLQGKLEDGTEPGEVHIYFSKPVSKEVLEFIESQLNRKIHVLSEVKDYNQ